jgi:hypothetical protein
VGYLNRCIMLLNEFRHHLRTLRCHDVSSYAGLPDVETQLRKRSFVLSSLTTL